MEKIQQKASMKVQEIITKFELKTCMKTSTKAVTKFSVKSTAERSTEIATESKGLFVIKTSEERAMKFVPDLPHFYPALCGFLV